MNRLVPAALALGLLCALPGCPAPQEDVGLYCKEHGVPEKYCTLCHEELKTSLPKCEEHGGLPEAVCTKCHPEAEKKYNLILCPKGHGLPAIYCNECEKTASLDLPEDGWCMAHHLPEAQCLECGGESKPECRKPLPTVRLASADVAKKAGIETATVGRESHVHKLEANAETAFDANHYAEVGPRVGGFLRAVNVDLGAVVKAGDVLAWVDSPEVGAAKARLASTKAALALAQAERSRTMALVARKALPAKEELEALTALSQAQSRALDAEQVLANLGLDAKALAQVAAGQDVSGRLPIVAPIAGTIVERHAVQGEAVQPTTQLFAVADLSSLWLWIDIYEEDLDSLRVGQVARFRTSGGRGAETVGPITWVGAKVDEVTRTTRARALLPNPKGRLRANQFGTVSIELEAPHEVVVVPRSAVQRDEESEVVFLPGEPGTYSPQRVITHPSDRPEVLEVAWGLKEGDKVVSKGSFWLKTEIMKGAIGAGCCE